MSGRLKPKPWPKCNICEGSGVDYGETCRGCGGSGRDPDCCENTGCGEPAVGFTDEGVYLCEGCLFEHETETT